MKSKFLLIGACVAVSFVAACGGNDNGSAPATTSTTTPPVTTPPPASNPTMFDTAQVLVMAEATSETSSPVEVNGGAFTFTDTSETTTPITVVQ